MSKKYSMQGPDGKMYSMMGPDNANPEEVKARIKEAYRVKKSARQSPISKTINKAMSTEISVPPIAQDIAKGLTMPGQGLRGLGVGAEQLALHPTQPASALNQAAEAVKPGFQPKPGQKLGAFAGNMADPINLAMSAAFPGTTFMRAVGGGALMGAGSSLLDQTAQGKINPGEAGLSGILGGATGGASHAVGTIGTELEKNAPSLYQTIAKIPKRATVYFKRNKGIEDSVSGTNLAVERGASDVVEALKNRNNASKRLYKSMAKKAGVAQTAEERSQLQPIPANKIAGRIKAIKSLIPQLNDSDRQIQQAQRFGVDPGRIRDTFDLRRREALKELLHLRDSIGHYMDPKSGTFSPVQSGLSELRRDVNNIIGSIPGGDLIRRADQMKAPVSELYKKLIPKMSTPSDAIKFLKDTFESEGPESRSNMALLQDLERMTGKKVVNNMFKILTMAKYQEKLGGNKISRSIAGASPFLLSALLRVVGIPFQFSLPLSAGLATASQSPALLGKMLRGAQTYKPYEKAVSQGLGDVSMTLIRNRKKRNANPVSQ